MNVIFNLFEVLLKKTEKSRDFFYEFSRQFFKTRFLSPDSGRDGLFGALLIVVLL